MHATSTPFRFGRLGLIGFALAGSLLGGCATSQMTNMWKLPNVTGAPLRNVLVIALRKDDTRRRVIEDAFVEAFSSRGVKATSSYTIMPNLPDTAAVVAAVVEHGYDGVVVSVRQPSSTESHYVPGYVSSYPVGGYGYGYGGYGYGGYYGGYTTVASPGYVETTTTHYFETMVWRTTNHGELIWSGTLETTETPSVEQAKHDLNTLVLPEMAKSGII